MTSYKVLYNEEVAFRWYLNNLFTKYCLGQTSYVSKLTSTLVL